MARAGGACSLMSTATQLTREFQVKKSPEGDGRGTLAGNRAHLFPPCKLAVWLPGSVLGAAQPSAPSQPSVPHCSFPEAAWLFHKESIASLCLHTVLREQAFKADHH